MSSDEHKALKQFGNNVSKLRVSKSYTQEQLAERANLDRMTVAFIEGGRRWPRLSTIQAIAKTLEVEIKDFFNGI